MDSTPTPFEALRLAVGAAGSQAKFAEICGVSQPAVWKWLHTSKKLPAEHVIPVARWIKKNASATGVTRYDLRPDIYPHPLPHEGGDPGEDCGPILIERDDSVAFDRRTKANLAGTGQ